MKSLRLFAVLLAAFCLSNGWAADRAEQPAPKPRTHGSLSPSAPVNLTYHVNDSGAAGQPINIDIAITTRLASGTLLVEVAKQEGVTLLDTVSQRIDLTAAVRPITIQLRAIPTAESESFIVLLLTVDTEMGQMSRSFRIDVTPSAVNDNAG